MILLTVAIVHSGCTKQAKVDRALARGAKHFEAGAYDKARIEYMSALQQGGKNPAAIRQLALIWLKHGSQLKAAPFLLEAKKTNPSDMEIREHLAAVLLALGDIAAARAEALEILQHDPSNERVLLVLADTSRTGDELAQAKEIFSRPPASQTAGGQAALAVLHLRENRPAEATQAADQALKINGNSADAHVAKAGTYLLLKDLPKAEEYFRKASELAPARSATRLRLADFLTQKRDLDGALAEAERQVKEAEDYLPALLMHARLISAKGDHDKALALLSAVFSRDNNSYEGLLLAAKIQLAKGNIEKAAEVLERLTAGYPNAPGPYVLLAQAHMQGNTPAKAIAVLEKALTVHPQFPEALLMLGEINLRTGKAQAATEHLRKLLTLAPNHSLAKLLLAQSCRATGRLDEALQLAKELRTALPKWDQAALVLGLVLQQQGKLEEARTALEAAAELEPNNLNAASQLIELALTQKDFASAEARAEGLLKKLPTSAAANFLLGRVHAAKGNWSASEAALQKTLELDPNFSPAYNLLSGMLAASNRLTEALGQMEDVLSKTPDNTRALMLTALVREKMQDYSSARESYEKLIAVAPEFTPALNNLAWLYVEHLNEPAKAHELASKARALNPTDPAIADTLGWALFKRGDYQSALTLFQESAGLLGALPELQYHLGMAYYMMGNSDAAQAAFEKAVQSPEEFGGKAEAERRLTMLKSMEPSGKSQAAAALQAAVDANPRDVVALTNLASFHQRAGNAEQAAALYKKALDVNPRLASAASKLAKLYAGSLGDLTAALEWAKKARQLAPSDPEATASLGQVALATDDAAWAYGLLTESARQLPKDDRLQADLAWAAYRVGRLDQAQSIMEQIASAAADSSIAEEAKRFLHFTAMSQSEAPITATAVSEADELLKKDQGFLPAIFVKARYQLEQGNGDMEGLLMEEILKRNPNFVPAQRQLVLFYGKHGHNLARAYELGAKARKALPQDQELNRTFARVSYKQKEYRLAVQVLEDVARSSTLAAEDLFVLGMSLTELKQKEKSRETLEKALKAGLSGMDADEANRMLTIEPPAS